MRLMNAETYEVKEFFKSVPWYAILSHTWEEEEVLLKELENDAWKTKKGGVKMMNACRVARDHGYEWIWIDTCLIDKTSSAELSEAINSMYRWYQESRVCYAFLQDVNYEQGKSDFPENQFRKSRWFTRGWTLQELIAPMDLRFYSANWTYLGTKTDLCDMVSMITGIPTTVLQTGRVMNRIVAEKISWVSNRETTRTEDIAYCLLGLLDINMPLLYGEGTKAFRRLQEEIIRQYEDRSILLFGIPDFRSLSPMSCLAKSPQAFNNAGLYVFDGERYQHIPYTSLQDLAMQTMGSDVAPAHYFEYFMTFRDFLGVEVAPMQVTSRGIRAELLVVPVKGELHKFYAWTNYVVYGRLLCMLLESDGPICARIGRLYLIKPAEFEKYEKKLFYLRK